MAQSVPFPADLKSNGNLVEEIFEGEYVDPDHVAGRVILAPKNINIDTINNSILEKLPGNADDFNSIDSVEKQNEDDQLQLTTEILNSLNPGNFPPHRLRRKESAVVILLRNLNQGGGLSNGTRLQVVDLSNPYILKCQFITGERKGEDVLLPRIDLIEEKGLSFKLKRRQFPVRLAFAMTINKSQGQSFEKVGLYLPTDVFSHGQCYVGCSRATSRELKIWAEGKTNQFVNVVDKRVFED